MAVSSRVGLLLFGVQTLLMVCVVISLFAAAASFPDETLAGYKFNPVWAGLTFIAFYCFAALTILRWRSAFNIGGVVVGYLMMLAYALDESVYFAALSSEHKDLYDEYNGAFVASSVFAGFYFAIGSLLAFFLIQFYMSLIKEDKEAPRQIGEDRRNILGEPDKQGYDTRPVDLDESGA